MESKATATEQRRYERRKAAVDSVVSGEKPTVVARVLRVPTRTIFHWLARYRRGGYHALRESKRQGRPRKVGGDLMQWLYNAITLGEPRQYQFEFCLWTLGIVRTMLKREHGVELSKSGVSRLLRHLGLSPQVPKYKSYRQDPNQMRKYLKRTFPALVREARRKGAVIYFVDEAAVRADAHQGTTWAPIGETPVVEDSGDRFGLKLISAVSARGDLKFETFQGRMNSVRFVEFLVKLRADTGRPIIIIADNASYHKDGTTKRYRKWTAEGIRVANLPPYAPELNPDEQVWHQLKSRLGKMFLENKDQMRQAIERTMKSIQRATDLVLSFFQLRDTKYAANSV